MDAEDKKQKAVGNDKFHRAARVMDMLFKKYDISKMLEEKACQETRCTEKAVKQYIALYNIEQREQRPKRKKEEKQDEDKVHKKHKAGKPQSDDEEGSD